jgi:hypothetical protein
LRDPGDITAWPIPCCRQMYGSSLIPCLDNGMG